MIYKVLFQGWHGQGGCALIVVDFPTREEADEAYLAVDSSVSPIVAFKLYR